MKLKHPFTALLVGAALLSCSAAQALEVTNVTARQRWPWNNLVDIDFVVVTNGTEKTPAFAIDITGTYSNGTREVYASTFVSSTVDAAAGTNRVTWNLGADHPGVRIADLTLAVTASEQPTYLVIDLSGGSSSDAYPVRYTNQGPDVSSDACRTDELWLRRITKGTFSMGSPSGEVGRQPAEDQHSVTLTKGFFIGVFEVTQKQWYNVMGTKPSFYSNAVCWATRPVETISYQGVRGWSSGANWPASSSVDAYSFLGKLRSKTGVNTFDLPTDAQWEYACRAGKTTSLNSGKNIVNATGTDANLGEIARYTGNRISHTDGSVPDTQATAKVGSYPPNAWGLYDMHGNVWERCLDWYAASLGTAAAADPVGPGANVSGLGRVIRGGCCADNPNYCRSAMRNTAAAAFAHARQGFRLAKQP